ncbi:MAG TPA: PAS domain-containing protein [Gemmatimonadaceae bacterium]|nr:PAS domain-containing protein [Gemmatimonadaceae bacterium]
MTQPDRTGEALVATEAALFHQLTVRSLEFIAILEIDGRIRYISASVHAVLGYTPEELVGRYPVEFVHKDDRQTMMETHDRVANGGSGAVADMIIRLCHKDGSWRYFEGGGQNLLHDPVVAGITVSARDVTRRKVFENQMEEARRTADVDRRRLEATLQAIPVGVWIADASGRMIHSNPAAARIWGGQAPHVGAPEGYAVYRASWPSTGAPLALNEYPLPRALRTGNSVDWVTIDIERFDNTRGHILNSASPIFDADGVVTGGVAVSVDITDRQVAAQERDRLLASLEIERARLATVFEQAPSFLAVLRGPEYVFERVNPACQTLLGQRELIGKSVLDALPEIRDQGFMALLDRVRETGEPFVSHESPVTLMRGTDGVGETRYVDMVFQRLADPDGQPRVVVHGVDITEQVVAAIALRRTEQRLREQFAKLPVPTFLWESRDADFVLVDLNDAADGFVTPLAHEAIGQTATQLFPAGWEMRADAIRSLRDGVVVRRAVTEDAGPGHEPRTFDLTIGPQQPDRVLVHVFETTEQTRLATALRQAQKMEAVGQLAGGVAHDFNNLLTVIGAHSAFLLEELGEADPRHLDALAIREAGDRAAGLTRQLLAFSRKQILQPAVIDLNVVVRETNRMLERLLGEDVDVVLTLAPALPSVLVDIGQVEQVLMNLVLNARDAMPGGGRLFISTREAVVPANSMARGIVPPGHYAVMTVADTGVGMTLETEAHIFEPFFTTKEVGKGTGLGLSTVYGIVTQSGGYVTVESAPGAGAAFDVYLPIVSGELNLDSLDGKNASATKRSETVLLVEDDPSVREIAKRILVREGYHVLEASDGRAALTLSASHSGKIDAVITDAVMPGMTGAAVLNEIRAERPNCKAILMSGYTDDEMTRRGISASDVAFVQKPFTPEDFARQVRHVLDS